MLIKVQTLLAVLLHCVLFNNVTPFENVYVSKYLDTSSSQNVDIDVFFIIPKLSIRDCIENCKARKRCQFVNYMARTKTCFLLEVDSGLVTTVVHSTSRITDMPGYFFGIKQEWNLNDEEVCTSCPDTGPCPNNIGGNVTGENVTSPALGVCKSSGCDDPSQNATVVYGTNYIPDNWIKYYCITNYKLHITSTAVCKNDGHWSPTNFTCKYDCGIHTITNGQFTATDGTEEGMSATISCNPGYDSSGDRLFNCTDTGWDGHAICTPKDCGDPTPQYASANGTVFWYQSVIKISCNTGLLMSGTPVITCQADGSWSGSPTCDCGVLTISNGQFTALAGTEVGMSATISCNTGYDLDGDSVVNCIHTGWDGSAVCTPRDCGVLTINNGLFTALAGTEVGMSATISCNAGYDLNGDMVVNCINTGWDGSAVCTPRDCGVLTINNGQFTALAGTEVGMSATISCNTGYILDGDMMVNCINTGWDGSAVCTLRDCGDPTPQHGLASSSSYTYGSALSISCDTGYVITGSSVITCQADGTWSGSPTCGCANNYENKCYKVNRRYKSWTQAKSYCESLSGHLVDINSAGEQSFVADLVRSNDDSVAHWIGGNDKSVEGQFRWSDNTLISSGYTNWQPDQPDEYNDGEDCMDIMPQGSLNYRWNDHVCTYAFPSICEID